jgi:alpha-N-acetylglucosamine transferase
MLTRPRLLLGIISGTVIFILVLGFQRNLALPTQRNGPQSILNTADDTKVSDSEKLGYVTWLGKTGTGSDSEDVYFLATRILVYQILHDPVTRSPNSLPIVVMTTPDVAPSNRARLIKDGATVHEIDFITEGMDWLKPRRKTWRNIMAKLRAWQLTSFDRLLMLDTDMLLRRPLDALFSEPSAQLAMTLDPSTLPSSQLRPDEGLLPAHYLLAGGPEVLSENHTFPPSREANDFIHPYSLNMGFCLLAPSLELFEYYLSILRIPKRFNSATMEQSLLNYAHRRDGPMPWVDIPFTWTTTKPNVKDLVGQVASWHMKWWKPVDYLPEVGEWAMRKKEEMLRFYEQKDRATK